MKKVRILCLLLCLFCLAGLSACNTITTKQAASYNDELDQYQTAVIPDGKPVPVNAEDQEVDQNTTGTCTLLVECSTLLDNMNSLKEEKRSLVPDDGVILKKQEITFYNGESVMDVLQRIMQDNKIQMEFTWTPGYGSGYVEGIHNLYEFDCGDLSGWMFCVNGWYPNYGASRYIVSQGDAIEWHYTCDLGEDLGQEVE